MRFETRAIHVGQDPDAEYGSVNVPIYQTSTYAQPAVGKPKAWDYARAGNPTREALQQVLASLEGGSKGPVLLERPRGHDHPAAHAEAWRPRPDLGRRVRRHLPSPRPRHGPVGPRLRHRGHDGPRRVPFRRTGGHGARVGGVPHQPLPEGGRYRRRGGPRAPGRGAVRRRQHVRDPVPAAAARARRRRGAALDDEVPRRALGPDRRRARDERRRAGRTPLLPRERGRRRPGSDGLLPRAARREDAGPSDAGALPRRQADCRVPPDAQAGHSRALPGASRSPGIRGRGPADEGLRRDGELRGRHARRGDPGGGVDRSCSSSRSRWAGSSR